MHIFIFILALLFGFSVQAHWNLNDVSFLLPLPEEVGSDSLLKIGDSDARGVILPKLLVDRLPPLLMSSSRDETDAALRVVSIRIDPCFINPVPRPCEKQIRFVWQPLFEGPRHTVIAEDAALHSFYTLDDSEFSSLLQDLKEWKQTNHVDTENLALQVLPILRNPAKGNPFLISLQKIFLKYTGSSNLTKLTAMVLRGGGDMWAFAQFDIVGGNPVMQPIPRLDGKLSQAFVNQINPATSFGRVAITPEPNSEDFFRTIVTSSQKLNESHDSLIVKEMEILYRIENPKNFHASNMDCVSCHLAEPAKQWALRARPHLELGNAWPQSVYRNERHNLKNMTPVMWSTHMVRSFGYFSDRPAISQRVINESADVADQLQTLSP